MVEPPAWVGQKGESQPCAKGVGEQCVWVYALGRAMPSALPSAARSALFPLHGSNGKRARCYRNCNTPLDDAKPQSSGAYLTPGYSKGYRSVETIPSTRGVVCVAETCKTQSAESESEGGDCPGQSCLYYLVDPTSKRMLLPRAKPCTSEMKWCLHNWSANGSLYQLLSIRQTISDVSRARSGHSLGWPRQRLSHSHSDAADILLKEMANTC